MFSCEFCEISKSTFFTEHLWATAFVNLITCNNYLFLARGYYERNFYEAEIIERVSCIHVSKLILVLENLITVMISKIINFESTLMYIETTS